MSADTPAAVPWRFENARWLRLALRRLRLRLQGLALRGASAEPRMLDWLVADDDAALAGAAPAAIAGAMAAIDAAQRALEDRLRTAGARPPALMALADQLALSALETELLLLAAAPALDGAFATAYASLHGDGRRGHATLQLALALCVDDADERLLAADCLLPSRPLRALGVDERLADYLRGANHVDARLDELLGALPAALPGASATAAGDRVAATVSADAGRWASINLIGQFERGAADVVRAACDALGVHPRLLDLARFAAAPPAERQALLTLMAREAVLAGLAVVVDATRVTAQPELTPVVDELLASLAATLFVVSAERWPGRHALALVRVPAPTRDEQRALWANALNGHAHGLGDAVDAIVQQFDFGGTAIADVVARAAHGGADLSGPALWAACREQTGAALDAFARRLTPCYGWDDIVVAADVRAQLLELAAQVEQRACVYEAWGFGARLARGRGISALFAGPSGTGKTMAAEILAAHLRLDLYRIDLAGVVSKYVGETEKNLRAVFDAAERSGAILLFDEADALFGNRTEVRDSHDRYANLEINYLLQRMEDYAGLAILATNRRSALDSAFLRRLRFVIDFPFPGSDDRRRIWERAFPRAAPTERLELAFLSRLELSGGNIKSIALNAAFLAAGARAPIRMDSVVRAAAREYAKLSKPISSAEFGAYYAVAQS